MTKGAGGIAAPGKVMKDVLIMVTFWSYSKLWFRGRLRGNMACAVL